ncbi:MAG: carboxy terminal-processing peptidase [Lentisphaeria bacterium]|nr:carboxy terminal-processing peptidase [Lentisphaeria bacterium]
MKKRFFLLFFLLPAVTASVVHAAAERAYRDGELSMITRLATWVFYRNHYRPQKIDGNFSHTLFDEYFDTLDPQRLYFTRRDVAEFSSFRDGLGPSLLKGETEFAFRLYQLYRKRLGEFIRFAETECRTPADFTVDEYWDLKRDKAERPADAAEQRELWRLRVKNDRLYYHLVDKAMAEDKDLQKDKKQEAAAAAWKWAGTTPEKCLLKRLRDISNEVMKKDRIDILGTYLNTLAQVFGPHSSYYPPKLSEDFDINMSLSLTGIGATLSSDDGFIKVVSLVPGGPAAKDGRLRVEDRIAAAVQQNLDATNLIDMPVSQAVRYIRGPVDSRVCLGVLTDKRGANPLPLNSVVTFLTYFSQLTGLPDVSGAFPEWRGNIYLRPYVLKRSKVELVDNGAKGKVRSVRSADGRTRKVGVLELPSFYHDFSAVRRGDANARRCSVDVEKILADFNREKVDAVLIDLRHNGGGSLPEALEMTGLFIRTGPIVQVRNTDKSIDVEEDDNPKMVYSGPLVILTSKLSASASEIFTAALQDCSRAIVVGDSRTFGKGTILKVEELTPHFRWLARRLPAGSATFETAMFYRITGDSVQQLGITPDIKLPSFTEEVKIGEMFLPHHLPFDQIQPVPCGQFDTDIRRKAKLLGEASAKRIQASPEYRLLNKRIANYRAHRDRTRISLLESKRWAEYRTVKEMDEAAERLLSGDQELKKKDKPLSDPVLNEAVSIAADYAAMK